MPIIHCALVFARAFKRETITVNGKPCDVHPWREKTLSPTG